MEVEVVSHPHLSNAVSRNTKFDALHRGKKSSFRLYHTSHMERNVSLGDIDEELMFFVCLFVVFSSTDQVVDPAVAR